jgi:GH18 family chitinase
VGVDVLVDGRVDEARRVTVSIAGSSASVEVSELTPEEAIAAFDRVARMALDLSGEEFLALPLVR